MSVRGLARCAVMSALLVAVQYCLGFVPGIELVTAVFSAYCFVCGTASGILTAVCFSLLRCLIYGFYPAVILLYLIYYPLLALAFSNLSKIPPKAFKIALLISALLCLTGFVFGIKISAVYRLRIRILFLILFIIFSALFVLTVIKRAELSSNAASAAAVMTVLFTLLDDVISPLMLGFSAKSAEAYFYGGFLVMLPQTLCASISVFILFEPLKRAFEAALRSSQKR